MTTQNIKLDTITTATRFVTSAAPKVATRVALGTVLAAEDVVADPTAQLLAAKTGRAFSFLGSKAKDAGSAIASKVSDVDGSKVKGALHSVGQKVQAIPGVSKATEFVTTAAEELGEAWQAAGQVTVEVNALNQTDTQAIDEDDAHTAMLIAREEQREAAEHDLYSDPSFTG